LGLKGLNWFTQHIAGQRQKQELILSDQHHSPERQAQQADGIDQELILSV
jgi:hypothetical protein